MIAKEAWDAVNTCTPCHPESFVQGYIVGAESRDNQIADLKEEINKIAFARGELEAQIEKMKCCGNCEWKAKGVCNGNDTCGLKEWKLAETRR